jgi:hypothetical protein
MIKILDNYLKELSHNDIKKKFNLMIIRLILEEEILGLNAC